MRCNGFTSTLCAVAIGVALAGALAPAPPAAAQTAGTAGVAAKPPLYVEVYVRGEKRDQKVAGKLLEHDAQHIVVETSAGPRDLRWDELTTTSAFTLKSRLIDRTRARDWLDLGRWAWANGAERDARAAFTQARRLDPGMASAIDAVLATPLGSGRGDAAAGEATSATTKPTDHGEDAGPAPTATAGDPEGITAPRMQRGYERGQRVVRYTTPTEAQNQKSIELSRKRKGEVETTLAITLVEVETPHFLIYTDWDAREHGFLKERCEGAYRTVARQFEMPPTGNVFVGKLPVYMFKRAVDFRRFATEVDEQNLPPTVLGYFISSDDMGHMAMWKPTIGEGVGAGQSLADAERRWSRTLVHEFCHAFIHRYKTSVFVPRWINEGMAEFISEATLPTNNYRGMARQMALQDADVMPLFDDSSMPGGAYYPVMMTMVECLVKQDKAKFIAMFNDIKDGVEPEAALKKHYGFGYGTLVDGWQKYAKSLR